MGKYNGQQDSYLSVIKAVSHCGIMLGVDVSLLWVDAEELENPAVDNAAALAAHQVRTHIGCS